MKEQSAVKFLEEKIKIYLPSIHQKGLEDAFKQANKMFEQQIIDAVLFGMQKGLNINKVPETDGDWVNNYYTSTYGSKGSDDVKKKDRTCNNSCSVVCGECQIWGISDDCEEVKNWDSFVHKKNQELISFQTEISDEEIGQEFKHYSDSWEIRQALEEGAKWYREQLKKKQ